MSASSYHLIASGIGLIASVVVLAIAGLTLLKRPESASLFVEDQFGYFIVKVIAALMFAVVGFSGFGRSLDYLFRA